MNKRINLGENFFSELVTTLSQHLTTLDSDALFAHSKNSNSASYRFAVNTCAFVTRLHKHLMSLCCVENIELFSLVERNVVNYEKLKLKIWGDWAGEGGFIRRSPGMNCHTVSLHIT